MKKTIQLFCVMFAAGIYSTSFAACPSEPGCTTNWLNVPGDFSQPVNNFTMNLLGGWFNVDYQDSNGWHGISASDLGGTTPINTLGNQINFTATQFNHIGPGQGTSILNGNLNHVVIGYTPDFFGLPVTIYDDGQTTGTLVDNASSTQGQWTLNTHLYAEFGGIPLDLGFMPLSTNASYSYNVAASCDANGLICFRAQNTVAAGSIMDYHSGIAFMVGQNTMQSGPFQGLRVTIGLQGQDPLAAPIPPAAWLLGSGLIGLAGVARKRKAS